MDTPSTLSFQGWSIKYALSEPSSISPSSTITNLVFIHGTPWSSIVFHPLAKALLSTNRYRILLYDLPGYGKSQEYSDSDHSTLFAGDTSVKTQAAALNELLGHLKLDGKDGNAKPAIIAHDIAGTIALRTHLLHGCEFESLMLWDTNVVLPWGDGFYKLARSEPEVFLKMPGNIFEAVVRAVVRSGCHDPKKLVPGWEDALARPWLPQNDEDAGIPSPQQRSFIRQIAQANDADVAEMLDHDLYRNVKCPVKILWGQKDTWIPKEKMDRLADMIKHVLKAYVVVPDAGHLLMIDQPERIMLEVVEWLERQQ